MKIKLKDEVLTIYVLASVYNNNVKESIIFRTSTLTLHIRTV